MPRDLFFALQTTTPCNKFWIAMVAAVVTNQYGMYTQSFPPTSKFLESDVPDLTGKVNLIFLFYFYLSLIFEYS